METTFASPLGTYLSDGYTVGTVYAFLGFWILGNRIPLKSFSLTALGVPIRTINTKEFE